MAQLVKLFVENFKKISVVEFEPKGNISIISGLNEQGKSSLLDSISVLLQGKAAKIPEPVKRGASKAKISGTILTDKWDSFDDMVVTRTITKTGNWYLKIEDKTGKKYSSPESMLKKIFGEAIDPCEFVKMKSNKRIEVLKQITGLDFTELDIERNELYNTRLLVGREIKQIEGNIKGMESYYPEAPKEKVSVTALLKDLAEIQAKNHMNNKKKDELEQIDPEIKGAKQRLEDMKEDLRRIQQKINDAEVFIAGLYDDKIKLQKEVEGLVYADEQEIKDKIAKAEETNNRIDSNTRLKKETENLNTKRCEHQALTNKIQKIDTDKQTQLSKIDFPVQGLSFNDSDVTYNDLPFDAKQLSSEELLRVSFAIAIAARPNLKNILIREGSLLDDNNLKLIGTMAEDAGIHCFIEVVGDNADKATILIENGEIKDASTETIDIDEDEFSDI